MKPFFAIAIISLLVCSQLVAFSGAEQRTAASSKFAFKLYNQVLKQSTNTNVFVSPSSISIALAMTYNGTEGKTREAMARVLDIEGLSLNEVNNAFAELQRPPASADPKVKLNIANSLWARQGFVLKPDFVARTKQYYEAKVTSLDFNSPTAPAAINSWVKEKTDNLIDSIVDQIQPDTILFLINAIYFKGSGGLSSKKKKPNQINFTFPTASRKKFK